MFISLILRYDVSQRMKESMRAFTRNQSRSILRVFIERTKNPAILNDQQPPKPNISVQITIQNRLIFRQLSQLALLYIYNLTSMQTYYHPQGCPLLQAMSSFGHDLKRLQQSIKKFQSTMEQGSNVEGLDAMQCTSTESFQLQESPRKSIIDDLDPELLKQTSSTNNLDLRNRIFSIKEVTQWDSISFSHTKSQFEDFFEMKEEKKTEKAEKEVQVGARKPKLSHVKLKNLMLQQLTSSSVVQRIDVSVRQKPAQKSEQLPLQINFSYASKGGNSIVKGGNIVQGRQNICSTLR